MFAAKPSWPSTRLAPAAGIDSGQRWVSNRVVTKARRGIAMTGTRQILFIQGGGAGVHGDQYQQT
jgi:hypothetical protein